MEQNIKVYKYLNEYINELKKQKNDISNNEFFNDGYEEKINEIKDLINNLCSHKWITDEFDLNNGEGTYKINYCKYCYTQK